MAFKLGSEKRGFKNSSNTNIFRKKLENGVLGEATNDGKIYVCSSVPDSMVEHVAVHEAQHQTAMQLGTETYDDNAVYFHGEVWPRGDGYVMDPNTGKKYIEGSKELPWESNKI